jgi:hypothetical protein
MKNETIDNSCPDRLLDFLIERLKLKNDAALCRILKLPPPVISKIRHQKLSIGAGMLIRMHEVTGLSIYGLKAILTTDEPEALPEEIFENRALAETTGRMREANEIQLAIESGKLRTVDEVYKAVIARARVIRGKLDAAGVCVAP